MDNLYVFHGTDRKVGVTMLAQSVAECAARLVRTEDILLVTLSGRRNAQYLKDDVTPIDSYRAKLESGIGILKCEIDRAKNLPNLYMISGIQNEREERMYMPEMARALLKDVCSQFRIVIADCGSELDNGLAVGGLISAKQVFMILSQNESTLRRFEHIKKLYSDLSINFDGVIVNKYSERDPYSSGYIRKRLGIDTAEFFKVNLASLGRHAEMEYRTILDMNDDEFIKDIEQITFKLLGNAGIESVSKRKGRWKGFI